MVIDIVKVEVNAMEDAVCTASARKSLAQNGHRAFGKNQRCRQGCGQHGLDITASFVPITACADHFQDRPILEKRL